jgi:hypothetical protein
MSAAIKSLYRLIGSGGAIGLALALSACAYQGHIDQPVTIKATWFSYLAGDDIRQTCAPNGLPRYRLVYNGSYEEQLRSYEVVALDGGGARLVARVLGPMRAFAVIRTPADVQAPWRWTKSETLLLPQEFADFKAALDQSGLRQRLDGTTDLLSTEFYWIVSACERGEFLFNAWRYGTERYASLRFPEVLLSYDETGTALNPPRPVDPLDRLQARRTVGRRASGDAAQVFRVKVGPDGLVGMGPYL